MNNKLTIFLRDSRVLPDCSVTEIFRYFHLLFRGSSALFSFIKIFFCRAFQKYLRVIQNLSQKKKFFQYFSESYREFSSLIRFLQRKLKFFGSNSNFFVFDFDICHFIAIALEEKLFKIQVKIL